MKTTRFLFVCLCMVSGCFFLSSFMNDKFSWTAVVWLSAVFFILLLIILLLSATLYLGKKKQVKLIDEENKAISRSERNAVLQKLANEQLQSSNAEIRSIPIDQRWNLLKKEIDRVHNYFTIRLRNQFPHLKEDELRLCCLLRMGMDPYWIIRHLNISKEYFRKKKSRLAQTLQIKNSKGQLEKFINEF